MPGKKFEIYSNLNQYFFFIYAVDLALNPNTLVNNYSASLSTPTSPQGNDSNIVQYSQGPTPNQSPINCKDPKLFWQTEINENESKNSNSNLANNDTIIEFMKSFRFF